MRFLRRPTGRALLAVVVGGLIGLGVAGLPDRSVAPPDPVVTDEGIVATTTTVAPSEVPDAAPEVDAP